MDKTVPKTTERRVTASRRPRSAKLNLRDPAELKAELRRFSLAVFADEDVFPRRSDLIRERRSDLRYAIERYHGGFRTLRKASSQSSHKSKDASASPNVEKSIGKTPDNLDNFEVLSAKIRQFVEEHIVPLDEKHADLARTFFPTHAALRSAGRTDLVKAVRRAGGSRAVAARMQLGLHYHASTDYSGECKRFLAEMRRFAASEEKTRVAEELTDESEAARLFPTTAQLHSRGRLDLLSGIRAHGGSAAVAAALGMKLQRGRSSARVVSAALRVQEACGDAVPLNDALLGATEHAKTSGVIDGAVGYARTVFDEAFFQLDVCKEPAALHHNRGNRLRVAAHKEPRGGAGGALLPREGGRRRERYYFNNFENVRHELNCFIFDDGVPGVMPTAAELIRAGRRDLIRAMQLHGGQKTVAARLGLVRQSMSRKQVEAMNRDVVIYKS